MGTERITLGFDESERMRVGALYWEAFQRKLRPAFADSPTGLRVVQASLRSERLLVARSAAGSVSGVCGFHEDGTGAVAMTWTTMRGILSVGQALRASLVLSLLARDDEAGRSSWTGSACTATSEDPVSAPRFSMRPKLMHAYGVWAR